MHSVPAALLCPQMQRSLRCQLPGYVRCGRGASFFHLHGCVHGSSSPLSINCLVLSEEALVPSESAAWLCKLRQWYLLCQ